MAFANTVIGICWFVVVGVWLIYSVGTRNYDKEPKRRLSTWMRLLLFAAFILFLTVKDLRELNELHIFSHDYFIQGVGVFLCVVGVSFAIWARIRMGKHWGLPMVVDKNPVLLTTGPYSIVRHPIYTGLCLAMVGSMVTAGFLLFLWYFIWTLYFIYSAIEEEKVMLLQFPKEYSEYKKKTKMLIPFVL